MKKLKYLLQRITRGFGDDMTWDLGYNLVEYIYPRFKVFYERRNYGYPVGFTMEQWEDVLDQIMLALETTIIENYNGSEIFDTIEWNESTNNQNYGLELLGEYLLDLWD